MFFVRPNLFITCCERRFNPKTYVDTDLKLTISAASFTACDLVTAFRVAKKGFLSNDILQNRYANSKRDGKNECRNKKHFVVAT